MNNLTCPKCETLLKQTMTETGMLWLCETCAGIAVNVAVLRKCLSVKVVREFWFKATNEGQPSDRKCPSCAQKLREFTVGEYNRQVQLDLCKMCQLIWFDRNELEMFPKAEKSSGQDMPWGYAIQMASLEKQFADEGEPADDRFNFIVDILALIVRFIVFRS